MTEKTYEKLEKRLEKAKVKMILDHPFFGTIALNMPFIIDDQLQPPTAATNGCEVRFHPEFMSKLTDDEMLFVVAHEVCHPMFDHLTRRGARDPMLWNIAADIVINQLLVDDNIGKAPTGVMLDKKIHDKGEGNTDKIYRLVEKEAEKGKKFTQPGTGGGTGSLDNMGDAPGNAAEMEADWKVKVAQAGQVAKMAGKLSANQQRLVGELLAPKVDWREVLRRFVMKTKDDIRTYARPNRRFMAQDLIIPTVTGEAMGHLVVAIDTSGSIGAVELNQFAAEIRAIAQDARPKTVEIIYFDSEVCHHDTFQRDEHIEISPHGGGGTAFSPIFRFIESKNIEPVATVVLTDLCCSDFGPAPNYPVLWVSTHKGQAPWGEIVYML